MKIVENLEHYKIKESTAIAIGKFDGIHIGHQMLIQQMIDWKKEGLTSVVVVFYFPNTSVFEGIATKEIMTKAEKRAFFNAIGIDVLVEFPLNETTAAMSPLAFIREVLLDHLNMKKIVAGADISYGYKGQGNAKLLEQYKREYHYDMVIIDKVCYKEREISSTFIREEVEKGNLKLAEQLLGAPYSVTEQIDREISQNGQNNTHIYTLSLLEGKLIPPMGWYQANVKRDKEEYTTMVQIGSYQSKEGKRLSTLEIHTNITQIGIGDMVTVELLCKC